MGDGEVKFTNLSGFMQGVLILLSILGVVVPATLGFVNLDKRIDTAETNHKTHVEKDDKFKEKVNGDIEEICDDVHALELIDKELEIKYAEILRRFDELSDQQKITNTKLDNLVRAE
jgi:hypothetical protein